MASKISLQYERAPVPEALNEYKGAGGYKAVKIANDDNIKKASQQKLYRPLYA